MAYGGLDRRVPIDHGERMRAAMQAAGQQPEYIVYDGEGHGWLKVENRIDFWQRVEKFLAKTSTDSPKEIAMYTQAMDTMGKDRDDVPKAVRWPRRWPAGRVRRRIDAGDFIEARNSMPEHYRKTLVRQISQHAHSEIVGTLPEGNWISRAPTLKRKAILLAKVQDEAGQASTFIGCETLGTCATSCSTRSIPARPGQLDLQPPDCSPGRHGHDRLARRRRGDHEPGRSAAACTRRTRRKRARPRWPGGGRRRSSPWCRHRPRSTPQRSTCWAKR